jgi:hypothetical protein
MKPRTTEYFHRQHDTADGLANRCKVCVAEYHKTLYTDKEKKKRRSRQKTTWAKANRQALREEHEEKIAVFLRVLQREGHQILERHTAKTGRTTLVRVLFKDGDVRTIYFTWKYNQFYRIESDGLSKAERQIKKRFKKSAKYEARRDKAS